MPSLPSYGSESVSSRYPAICAPMPTDASSLESAFSILSSTNSTVFLGLSISQLTGSAVIVSSAGGSCSMPVIRKVAKSPTGTTIDKAKRAFNSRPFSFLILNPRISFVVFHLVVYKICVIIKRLVNKAYREIF